MAVAVPNLVESSWPWNGYDFPKPALERTLRESVRTSSAVLVTEVLVDQYWIMDWD